MNIPPLYDFDRDGLRLAGAALLRGVLSALGGARFQSVTVGRPGLGRSNFLRSTFIVRTRQSSDSLPTRSELAATRRFLVKNLSGCKIAIPVSEVSDQKPNQSDVGHKVILG